VPEARDAEDPLVAKAFDADQHEALARAVQQLDPEQAAYFLAKLERAIKKRKLQLVGYLAAMGVWMIGMVVAFVFSGTHSGFTAWVFLAPFVAVGLVLYVFGKWADKAGSSPADPAK
jgi:hypothetical protein